MGQAGSSSSGSRGPSDSRQRARARPTSWAPSLHFSPHADHDAIPELMQASQTSSSRSSSPWGSPWSILSRRSDGSDAGSSGPDGASQLARRRSRIGRARTSLASLPNLFSRRTLSSSRGTSIPYASSSTTSFPVASRSTLRHTASAPYDQGPFLPHFQVPELDLNFDDLLPNLPHAEPHRHHHVHPSRLLPARGHARPTSMFPSLRPDRGLTRLGSSLRRRRSPLRRDEDQAAMLSRLLSVAAAATAASLMGEDHRAVSDARSVAGDGEDGTFDSFLQALQNGRIASALRQSGRDNEDGVEPVEPAPLNFFRMFRFGSSTPNSNRRSEGTTRSGSRAGGQGGSETANSDEEDGDGRMVPIIIVGIRSINPNSGAGHDDNIPPFLDALSSFPTPVGSPGESNIDGMLRQPHRFSHRRRASMGGLRNFPSNYDSQRHYRSPDRPRPWSTLTDSPSGPQPPPSTPASSGLSAVSSGTTTPTFATSPPSPTTQSSAPSRRGSFIRRGTGPNLETTAEEPQLPQRTPRQRRLSESDFTRYGSGASRRNGVVEPDHNPGEGSRSWIIYVLGGSYPENHPILTTPSLFTDSPTYEDMVLLSSLLGPAKPPVASEEDVADAGGLFTVKERDGTLVAEHIEGADMVVMPVDTRCLVCLCEFEASESGRKLVKCGHMFHQECIDQWLTTGRNSCPLCRGQGVDEKPEPADRPQAAPTSDVPDATSAQEVA